MGKINRNMTYEWISLDHAVDFLKILGKLRLMTGIEFVKVFNHLVSLRRPPYEK